MGRKRLDESEKKVRVVFWVTAGQKEYLDRHGIKVLFDGEAVELERGVEGETEPRSSAEGTEVSCKVPIPSQGELASCRLHRIGGLKGGVVYKANSGYVASCKDCREENR